MSALFPFQDTGVQFLVDNKTVLLADDVGLGKSTQALHALERLKSYPAMIVCPAGLRLNWVREASQWLPHRSTFILRGASTANAPAADIYVVSYDLIHRYINAGSGLKALVCDESQALGNPKSRRTRAVKQLTRAIPFRFLLSATPVMNRPAELVPQLEIIDKLRYFGGGWEFLCRYCDMKHNGFGWRAQGATHIDELTHRMEILKCWLRRTKAEVIKDFPERRIMRVDVETTDSDIIKAEQYIADHFNLMTYQDQQTQVMKLYHLLGVAKVQPAVDWINSLLENSNKKLVVFAHHQTVQHELRKAFMGYALTITADTPMDQRHLNVQLFRESDRARLMICSLKAASAGIDGLQHATDICLFVEQGWNPPTHDQAIGRLHRIGQLNCVDAYFLVIPDTFDEDLWWMVQQKKQTIDKINGEHVEKLRMRRGTQNA